MAKITYVYGNLRQEVDYTGESGKIVLDKNPFLIANKRVSSYNNGAYYPLQLIDVPQSDLTLTAVMTDAGLVKVRNGNITVDISDMVLNVIQKKGKNQPFSYTTLTVSRQLFIDQNIEMVQKSTEFLLDIFGITGTWIYERLEDNGSYYDITLVNKAYYLKNITLLSLLNFTISGNNITLTNFNITRSITWNANTNEGTFTIPFDGKSLTVKIKRNSYTLSGNQTQTDYSLTKISDCNPDDLFFFLAKYVAGYTQNAQIVIQPGYCYDEPDRLGVQDKYTMSQIEGFKNGAKNPTTSTKYTTVSLRLDEFCWDTLQSLAYLTNREMIFDDVAYFGPLTTNANKLYIDWQDPTNIPTGYTYTKVMAVAENDDQGSQYLTSSQKVVSEAYETTVAISDTTSSYVGQDIKYIAVDDTQTDTQQTNNSRRNTQAKIVALNALVKNFKPGDCVEYSVNETVFPTPSKTISDWSQFNTITSSDICFKFQTTIPNTNIIASETYYVKKTTSGVARWFEYDTDSPDRDTGYNVTEKLTSLIDNHNKITLTDVPLALKTVEYPACVTTYTWGNPEFMDEQTQFNDLTAVSQDSVLDNTSDTGISSGDATKLVVGNQYVHQLRDDRAGFTGLIMEKNIDNNVYRLVGYDQGKIQAQFNSEGKIEAGAGSVVLDESGVNIYHDGDKTTQLNDDGLTIYYDSNDTEYSPQNALKFQKIDQSGTDDEDKPLTPYRLYTKYDSSTQSTTSVVQAKRQTINNVTYPAVLEMVCDQGNTYNTMLTQSLSGTVGGNSTLDVNITSPSQTVIIRPPVNITNTCNVFFVDSRGVETYVLPPMITSSVRKSYGWVSYPYECTKIRFKNTEATSMTLSGWEIKYLTDVGDGADIVLNHTGIEMTGNMSLTGNIVQQGGSIVFNGVTGYEAANPALFNMPIVSTHQITAYGKINTGYDVLDDFACRRIYIGSGWPSGLIPQKGDILFRI